MPSLDGRDSMAEWLLDSQLKGKISYKESVALQDKTATSVENFSKAVPSAVIGGASDLVGAATAVGYNLRNIARGEKWAWPENFNDVPSTTDYYGDALGADTNSWAFIAGAVALPDATDAIKAGSKLLKGIKALQPRTGSKVSRLEDAIKLDGKGTHRDDIWESTGWWKGREGKWRFAVSDATAKVREDEISRLADLSFPKAKVGEIKSVKVRTDQALDHSQLFEVYPQLAGDPVLIKATKTADGWTMKQGALSGDRGSYNSQTRTMTINSTDPRSTLLHEVQHAIQNIEDFSRGASTEPLVEAVQAHRLADLMLDIADGGEEFLDLGRPQIVGAIKKAMPDADPNEITHLSNVAERILREGADDAFIQEWLTIRNVNGEKTKRWLEEVMTFKKGKGLSETLAEMDDIEIAELARMRYLYSAGEAEARLVQALSFVPQERLDKLSVDPHKLMQYLDPETTKKLNEGIPELRPMFENIAESSTLP